MVKLVAQRIKGVIYYFGLNHFILDKKKFMLFKMKYPNFYYRGIWDFTRYNVSRR